MLSLWLYDYFEYNTAKSGSEVWTAEEVAIGLDGILQSR